MAHTPRVDIEELVAAHSGVLPRSQLLAAGLSDRDIRNAVQSGAIRRLRTGWYAWPTANADVARAVTIGGVASCITALALHGVWVPFDPRLHLRRSRRLRKRQTPSNVVACDMVHDRSSPTPGAVDRLLDALSAASGCLTHEMLTVVIDSVLHLELATRDELEQLSVSAPDRFRCALAAADGTAESGTETLVRLRLSRLGIVLQPQTWIGSRRVDFVIDEWLIIEVDSKAWHLDPQAYERDRERDRQLAALGYQVVRLTYRQVIDGWAQVEADILAIVQHGGTPRSVGYAA